MSSRYNRTYKFTETMSACSRPAQVQARWVPALGSGVDIGSQHWGQGWTWGPSTGVRGRHGVPLGSQHWGREWTWGPSTGVGDGHGVPALGLWGGHGVPLGSQHWDQGVGYGVPLGSQHWGRGWTWSPTWVPALSWKSAYGVPPQSRSYLCLIPASKGKINVL